MDHVRRRSQAHALTAAVVAAVTMAACTRAPDACGPITEDRSDAGVLDGGPSDAGVGDAGRLDAGVPREDASVMPDAGQLLDAGSERDAGRARDAGRPRPTCASLGCDGEEACIVYTPFACTAPDDFVCPEGFADDTGHACGMLGPSVSCVRYLCEGAPRELTCAPVLPGECDGVESPCPPCGEGCYGVPSSFDEGIACAVRPVDAGM